MTSLLIAAIADDDTGATDLAGMLTEQGMRAIVALDADSPHLEAWVRDCDAVILGTAARSIPPQQAYERTFAAVRKLQQFHPRLIAIKYCSTFDSTTEGNIGPSIDAALDATGERFTIALPALPALGRTTYMGYHFVHQQLLSDSPMRHHPLNPMTNAHLPSHLQAQTKRRVSLLSYADDVPATLQQLRDDATEIAVLDCIDDAHLRRIGEAICDLPIITGSSAWAMVLPQVWRERGQWTAPATPFSLPRERGGSGTLIVSGSCSQATQRQNAWARAHMPVVALDTQAILAGAPVPPFLIEHIVSLLAEGKTCLLTTNPSAAPAEVSLAAGQHLSETLADTVSRIFARVTPTGLIIAGGETSSTLMRALHLGGVRIGANIEPGVPVCVSLVNPALALVLKSGNFGSDDFFGRAVTAIQNLPLPIESIS